MHNNQYTKKSDEILTNNFLSDDFLKSVRTEFKFKIIKSKKLNVIDMILYNYIRGKPLFNGIRTLRESTYNAINSALKDINLYHFFRHFKATSNSGFLNDSKLLRDNDQKEKIKYLFCDALQSSFIK